MKPLSLVLFLALSASPVPPSIAAPPKSAPTPTLTKPSALGPAVFLPSSGPPSALTIVPGLPGPIIAPATPEAPTVELPGDDTDSAESDAEELTLAVPNRLTAPPLANVRARAEDVEMWSSLRKDNQGRLRIKRGGEWKVTTLDPELQEALTQLLTSYQTPYSAVVALEPASGRVLAMAEHAEEDPALRGLATRALFPAASIFKIVTTAALLDAGVKPDDQACFHGGKRRVSERMLENSPRDRQCATLASALARSTNGVFVKLVHQHLKPETLRSWAKSFHFNETIAFSVPVEPSLAAVPEDPLGFAATGAGFGDVWLSPLHGALLAAVAANGGEWRSPVLCEDELAVPRAATPVLSAELAAQLTEMMEGTVTQGTARRIFRQRGFRVKGAVGKTGSLSDHHPFRDYSWFVGFAPKDNPQIAVAAVVVNNARWRIRAPFVAREAMRLYLDRPQGRLAIRR